MVCEIERRRALRLLDESSSPVVVVSAPAGSGKSILARQWTSRDGRPHATVRVASHMDDPVVLGAAMVDALETLGAPAPETRARLDRQGAGLLGHRAAGDVPPGPEPRRPVHPRRGRCAPPAAPRRLSALLETLCESCPSDSTIVLLTRSQAPDWLARVRATGRLAEVSSADLAFDLDEAALLLAAMGVPADASDTAAIVEHTEGWAVGVYLTALGLRSGDRAPADGARIAKGSDRIVADYLRTQVLATLSADQRRFLTLMLGAR